MKKDWIKAEEFLKKGGVVVIPTDTIYGIACSANSIKATNRIYKIKGRDKKKPFIILISSINDLKKFKISNYSTIRSNKRIYKIFRPKVSVILNSKLPAFRLVNKKNKNLFNLIKKVGPIATTSVNPQGLKQAVNIKEAKKYFGDKIDLYVKGGVKMSKPSTLIEYKNGAVTVLRKGAGLI